MSTFYNIAIYPTTGIQVVTVEGGGLVTATPSKLTICRANTNILSVLGLYDNELEQYWTVNSTVSGTLLDEFGNVIFTTALVFASGSNGNFIGTFGGSTFLPPVGRGYTLVIQGNNQGNSLNYPILAEVVNSTQFTGPPVS